ncbi:MAG: gfo/Idh/MocA family oxidoreductase, partial [Armatimonadetes bacterium]|nr:gfo/Idh/MocA family oxidoreductase [Armatimonadota bacterium]MCC6446216.1 gfo/Idh/MocA family oxidoreductase [Armatimonadota bacterium]
HVLDTMHAFHDASREGRHILLESSCPRPAPLPVGLKEGTLDE